MKRPHKKTKAPSPQTETKTKENPWNPHTRTPPPLMLLMALFQDQPDTRRQSQRRTDMSPLLERPRRFTTIG